MKWSQFLLARRGTHTGEVVALEEHASQMTRLGEKATRDQRLEHFTADIFGHVEGWVGDRMAGMISVLGLIFDRRNLYGHIAEFGVHHGLFLFLLNALRNDDEKCFAIDVFENQSLNIDGSGRGSLSVFRSHLETLLPTQQRYFVVVQRDTLSFSLRDIPKLFEGKGVKFLSIDGGHTSQHCRNDLQLAQEVLLPGGIIALDDYMSVHWPGVTEGLYGFMSSANRRLKPLFYFQNKLFLTTISEQPSWLEEFRSEIAVRFDDELRQGRWRDVEIAGAKCLSFE